ncbi:hypothetical protein FDI40_gp173 [Agrobacterium phage Atu_ph07]|uniref:Uncharacterized protein n=1 Tax=Agrobacterium phage Atu_ph07 TaxID=2024264 RepID=A0A2L0UZK4_9CAUD|nr:hypothetical protein FDI40_gp173 [Agrobacterium phage Atu_ph07]AUZ94955.1 hypothetical protein [Agrobacterium phage Atu_ph07]
MIFIVEFTDSFSDINGEIRKVFTVDATAASVIKSEVTAIYQKMFDGYTNGRVMNEIIWNDCKFETNAFINGGITVVITPIGDWPNMS